MVFGHEGGQGYPWDGLVVLWSSSDCLALYDEYFGAIYGFDAADVICGNCTFTDLNLLGGFFWGLCRWISYKLINYYCFIFTFYFLSVKA